MMIINSQNGMVRQLTAALASFSNPELRNRIPIETAPALSPKTVTCHQVLNSGWTNAVHLTYFVSVPTKAGDISLHPLKSWDLVLKAKIECIISCCFNACWKAEWSQPIVETDEYDRGSLMRLQTKRTCLYFIKRTRCTLWATITVPSYEEDPPAII